jgi:hypothetical protein
MQNKEQLLKMMSKLQSLSLLLHDEKSVGIHQEVNHFFYLQKIEEIKFLMMKLDNLNLQLSKLNEILELEHKQVFAQWKKDLRFINSYHRNKTHSATIL